MNGRILVTGSTGLIGSHVLEALARAGVDDVVPAGRRFAPDEAGEARGWPLDLTAPRLALPEGIAAVLHLAGEKRDAARMEAVNADGAARLVEAAAAAGARSFVHLSSVGVYGAPKHAGLVDEAFRHTPRGPYETSKDAGERLVRERCAAHGLRCVVLQPSNVLGLGPDGRRPLLGLLRMVARGRFFRFTGPEAWVNYVAVEDVAAAVVAALSAPAAGGTFIVNTPAPLRDFAGWIADELGAPAPARRLPQWIGAAAAQASAIGRALLKRELPFSPERYLEMTNTTRYDGSALARAVEGAYPLGIERAIRALARRYRADRVL